MSYTRSRSTSITVSGSQSQSFSYPASENGGSKSVTVYYQQEVPIHINVHVDTRSFDHSVQGCNTSLDVLTGAVVASESAQISSINLNANKVGSTIVEGFYKTIRSEISQQITELSQKADAHLVHLNELSKSCISKQKQMEKDYNRLTGHYLKIFNDLNTELSNRIYELNHAAFTFKKESDNNSLRIFGNDLVNIATTFGKENSDLQAKISSSALKNRALNTIHQANNFLLSLKKLETTIDQSMLKESVANQKYIPVSYIETNNDKHQIDKKVFFPDFIHRNDSSQMIEKINQQKWSPMKNKNKEQIQNILIIKLTRHTLLQIRRKTE